MPCSKTEDTPLSAAALLGSLGQLVDLLRQADGDQYARRPVTHFNCSLGEQVRHVLDHVACFICGLDSGRLDYDHRERGTEIERDRVAAIAEIERLDGRLQALGDRCVDEPCAFIIHPPEMDAPPVSAPSSLGRELSFVLSHTIHHLAIISAMCVELGLAVPKQVGYAPSTLAHVGHD